MGARSSTAEEIISWIAGHRAPGVAATYTAAVKACGDGATLSGKAPAYLWAPSEQCGHPHPPS